MSAGRLRRLAEEWDEELPGLLGQISGADVLLEELDYALRPPVHEGRVPTYGAVVVPTIEPEEWEVVTGITVRHRMAASLSDAATRRFADGTTSWVLRRADTTELLVFDRFVSSERDLVVVREASGATLVQRHPSGVVRVVGDFGVVRTTPTGWLHQPPVDGWLDAVATCQSPEQQAVLKRLLRFAVHDLGSRRIGALLVYRLGDGRTGVVEDRLPSPPPLRLEHPANLAPLGHVLSQVDGAAIFDADGVLTHLGARLAPSREAEEVVSGFGGTRHTTARRFSYDEPMALVIAVSEDGPVTVFRAGEVLGRSRGD